MSFILLFRQDKNKKGVHSMNALATYKKSEIYPTALRRITANTAG
jgi:hypothetical protein